ncbi:AAA family ATPase [Winogradskyella ouciana]|uniref:AAA family ATPase n=1 Tax=Winogradskyella ouciana TaxID=2608631 RepID=UPI003D2CB7F1
MKAKLRVKNFGPIAEVNLDLRNVNVIIGSQASGKSTLAKLYALCKSPSSFITDDSREYQEFRLYYERNEIKNIESIRFKEALKELNILSFLNSKSYIEYDSSIHYFKYSNGKISFNWKLSFDRSEINTIDDLYNFISEYGKLNTFFNYMMALDVYEKINPDKSSKNNDHVSEAIRLVNEHDLLKYIKKNKLDFDFLKKTIRSNFRYCELKLLDKTLYIPAERIIAPIIKGASLNLQKNKVPIPSHILNFAAEYENAQIDVLDLSFLGVDSRYKNVNGIDKIYLSKRKSLLLSEAATGFQSIVPLILTVLSHSDKYGYSNPSFVIEEPEISLYPKAQYELIKYLESKRKDGSLDTTYIHTYTTHSPYVLASFNNMLYAYKRHKELGESKNHELSKIMPKSNWLNPENFNAYSLKNGKAVKIFNRKVGLIDDNIIDDVTDYMNDDFDRIMSL